MCYIAGQKNKYSVLNECNRMLTYNIQYTMLQSARSRFETRLGELICSIYLILKASLGPAVYSASNRNEYQKQKKKNLESRAQPVRKADNLTDINESIVYTMWDFQYLTTLYASMVCYWDSYTLLYLSFIVLFIRYTPQHSFLNYSQFLSFS
jgi:hypothetical protein